MYGPGRDQGLTSGPSLAMAAAARGEGFEIGYDGIVQYDFAPDVGVAFARASAAATGRRARRELPRRPRRDADIVAAIEAVVPEVAGQITWTDDRLPFPETLEAAQLERLLGPLPRTPLAEGVRRTVEHYRTR